MNWRFDGLLWIRRLEFTAVVAMVIAAACVMIGQGAESYADRETSTLVAASDASASRSAGGERHAPAFNAIDYATTGSIKGQTVVLSPCGNGAGAR